MSYRTYIAATRAAYIAGIEAGIPAQELRAHTGVMGEAFVADYLGVSLVAEVNQRGHDLVDGDGLRVSVKTITSSTGVGVKANTIDQVDRVIVVWVDTTAAELDLCIVYDKAVEEFLGECAKLYRGVHRLQRSAMTFPNRHEGPTPFRIGDVVASHSDGGVTIRKHSSGSFTATVDGVQQPARPILLTMRDTMGLPDKTTNTTRSLGAQVFSHLGK